MKTDGIDALYAKINASETHAADIQAKINETQTDNTGNYDLYKNYSDNMGKYTSGQDFVEKAQTLKDTILAGTGVTGAQGYENVADMYNTAADAYDVYKAQDGEVDPDSELGKKIAELSTYMDQAIVYIDGLAEEVVQWAVKQTLTKEEAEAAGATWPDGYEAVANPVYTLDEDGHAKSVTFDATVANMQQVQQAKYDYGNLLPNALKYAEKKYDLTCKIKAQEARAAQIAKDEEAKIKALYDAQDKDIRDYLAALRYDTTEDVVAKYGTYKAAYIDEATKSKDIVVLNGGKATYDSKNKKWVYSYSDTSDTYKAIEATMALINPKKTVKINNVNTEVNNTDTLPGAILELKAAQDAVYAKNAGKLQDVVNLVYKDAAAIELPTLNEKAEPVVSNDDISAAIKANIADTEYKDGTTTQNARKAATAAVTAYTDAQNKYAAAVTNAANGTGLTATDYDQNEVFATSETEVTVQYAIDAYERFDDLLNAKLTADYQLDQQIANDKAEIETKAKAKADELKAALEELYTKLSDEEFKYAASADIDADDAVVNELVEAVATAKANQEYIWIDDITPEGETKEKTVNFFTSHFTNEDDAKLAFVESAVAQWKNAWPVIEAIDALDIKAVKGENGNYVVDDSAKTTAADAYDLLGTAEKAMVDKTATKKLDEVQTYIDNLNAAADIADLINKIPAIESVEAYNNNIESTVKDANDAVKALNDVIADKNAAEDAKATAQAKLDILNSTFKAEMDKLADVNAKCDVIGKAAAFDKAVSEAWTAMNPAEGDADTATATAKITDATKILDEMKKDSPASTDYMTKYATYEQLVRELNVTEAKVVESKANALLVGVGTYAAPQSKEDFNNALKPVQEAYDKLTDEQKATTEGQNAKKAIDNAIAANELYNAGNAAASALVDEIMAAYNKGDVTASTYDEQKAAVEAADAKLKEIDKLYKDNGPSKINDVTGKTQTGTTLAAARETLKTLQDKVTAAKAQADVMKAIAALPAAADVTAEDAAAVTAARKAYDALTPAQQREVTNYYALTDAEAKLSTIPEIQEAQKAADEVIAKIDAIGPVTAENAAEKQAAVEEARAAYDALTDLQKSLVDNVKTLEDAEKVISDNVIKAGDVNGDGSVNALDIFAVIDHILGRTALEGSALTRADMNNDGSVDISDVLQIIKAWA